MKEVLTMGWTSLNASYYKNGKVDVKTEIDNTFYRDNSSGTKFKCLKSSMVGSVYYSACERITTDGNRVVFGLVVKTSVNTKDYYNFSYKDMDETMCPYYYDCPKGILDLLTPTDNEYALQWRENCRKKAESKRDNDFSKLPLGTKIKLTMSYDSRFFKKGDVVTVVKTTWWGYKRPIWKVEGLGVKFSPQNIKSMEWELAS